MLLRQSSGLWRRSNPRRYAAAMCCVMLYSRNMLSVPLHVQPADKRKAAHGKPPRDNTAKPTKAPTSRAVAAMERARDTQAASPAPLARPATAPTSSSVMPPTLSANGQIPPILPSLAASTAGGMSSAGDLDSQTPLVYDFVASCFLNHASAYQRVLCGDTPRDSYPCPICAVLNMLPITCRMASAQPRPGLNPLQDLVNNLAQASASSRTARSDRYGACGHTMASLQIDDSVNIGSRNPSPGMSCVAVALHHITAMQLSCILFYCGD